MTLNYKSHFHDVESLEPKQRGHAFESLINKIFDDCGVLVTKRYRTDDTQQELDGAVLIYSKIFLVEVKSEKNETLAASKLFSFLGKINSKIEGTLGVFISYNELKSNFIESVRNGLRQNCILIHGEKNIKDIIDGKVNLKDYLEYCYIQAATKNRVYVDTSEFLTIPKMKNPDISTVSDSWLDIYKKLTDNTSPSDFKAYLESAYSKPLELSKKAINIYNTIGFTVPIRSKYNTLIEKLLEEEKKTFISILAEKLMAENWKAFTFESFFSMFKKYKLEFTSIQREAIIENVTEVLNGDWEEENKASLVIDLIYNSLTSQEKILLANKYLDIYCSTERLDKFEQKKMANKIFKDLGTEYFKDVRASIITAIRTYKVEENLYRDEEDDEEFLKKNTVRRVKTKYQKVFSDNKLDAKEFIEKEYDKL